MQFLLHFRRIRVKSAGYDASRSNRIDAHARGGPFARRGFRKSQHSATGRSRVGELGPAMPDIGDDVDDSPAICLHPAVVDFTHENEAAGKVASDYRFETLGRDGFHRRSILTAGIVHEPVDA